MGRLHHHYAKYEEHSPEMKTHIDNMYNLINQYAKDNGIPLSYTDDAERFVEAIATYISASSSEIRYSFFKSEDFR